MSGETDAFPPSTGLAIAATGYLKLVDQTLLPIEHVEIDCRDVPTVWEAIKSLARARSARHRSRSRLWGRVIGARSQGIRRCGNRATRPRGGDQAPSNQPADGRQPVLGT